MHSGAPWSPPYHAAMSNWDESFVDLTSYVSSGHLPLFIQGMDLRQDLRRGIIMGNQSLVLQSLGRNATGNYYCVATNAEGTTFSNPVQLDIKCNYFTAFGLQTKRFRAFNAFKSICVE